MVNSQTEVLHDLIEHLSMLSGQTDNRSHLRIPLRGQHQWCHFNGFGPSTKDAEHAK
jgi:hypothetical protein